MELKDLTPEQREKARACKSAEELIALAEQEGYEMSDDELSATRPAHSTTPSLTRGKRGTQCDAAVASWILSSSVSADK